MLVRRPLGARWSRAAYVLATTATASLVVAGCQATPSEPSRRASATESPSISEWRTASGSVGTVRIVGAQLVRTDSGTMLTATFSNTAEQDALQSVTGGGATWPAPESTADPISLGKLGSVTHLPDDAKVILKGLRPRPDDVVKVTFTFQHAGRGSLDVPVVSDTNHN